MDYIVSKAKGLFQYGDLSEDTRNQIKSMIIIHLITKVSLKNEKVLREKLIVIPEIAWVLDGFPEELICTVRIPFSLA